MPNAAETKETDYGVAEFGRALTTRCNPLD